MFSVNFVTFAFRGLFFCHDSLENVSGIDAFHLVPLPAAKRLVLPVNFWVFW